METERHMGGKGATTEWQQEQKRTLTQARRILYMGPYVLAHSTMVRCFCPVDTSAVLPATHACRSSFMGSELSA